MNSSSVTGSKSFLVEPHVVMSLPTDTKDQILILVNELLFSVQNWARGEAGALIVGGGRDIHAFMFYLIILTSFENKHYFQNFF